MSGPEFVLDEMRTTRLGFGEAMFCAGKSPAQIAAILESLRAPMLLTRLDPGRFAALPPGQQAALDYDPVSQTAFSGAPNPSMGLAEIAVVTAGTSDVPVALEAVRTLAFQGRRAEVIADVGVAGLWRLLRRVEELRAMRVIIVAAGMDAALPSVIGGLVGGVVIAVPTSVGYGVAAGGYAALNAILASCAPGIVTVNIDNGYGAACAALRVLGQSSAPDKTA
ncbi:nickel pincer cofactor biosynthesis protein LarB [Acidisphaera sp. L21]|uniref:nickel pincer cofactor biosynthesis protein LarB n=1 Tax=Acidisphaera sp. L21 TaxID=1641851 RepID=UPI00131C5668|nr:nickel pincer cofactor biosynthesis protein LarB [Acidisphaera sp. L21]